MERESLRSIFQREDSARSWHLKSVREAALLTDWTVCPPQGWKQDTPLPIIHQNIGALGIANMEAMAMLASYPPGIPWAGQTLPPDVEFDPRIEATTKNQWLWELQYQDAIILSAMESAGLNTPDNLAASSFHSSQQRAWRALLVAGDSLEQFTDDLRIRSIRLDHYTTERDSCCNVVSHTIWEKFDPLALTDEQFSKLRHAKTKAELQEVPVGQRIEDKYTRIEWQTGTKTWCLYQQMCDVDVWGEKELKPEENPYISSAIRLSEGFNYGVGFVDRIRPDLRSYDALMYAWKAYAGQKSKMVPVIDHGSPTREKDLLKPSGAPMRGRVVGGQAQDIAFLSANMTGNMQDVLAITERVRTDLGQSMMLASESIRNKERVTALEVSAIIGQVQQAMGGYFTPASDQLQRPKFDYARNFLRKKYPDVFRTDIPTGVEVLTGARAIARQNRAQILLTFADVAAKLGQAQIPEMNKGVTLDYIARYLGITEPGIVKTDAEQKADAKAAFNTAMAAQANATLMDTAGKVAEANLTSQSAA